MKILIIDDFKSTTVLFSKYLRAKGHECITSNDSRNGLNLILQNNFDMVLLDLNMPELSGFDIVDKLVKNGKIKETKVVIFTATTVTEKQITELLERAAYAFVKKPVPLAELKKILEKIEQENHQAVKYKS